MRISFLTSLLFLIFWQSNAQTCCSGGVPTANNLGLPKAEAKTVQVSLNYDLNVLNTLKTGFEKLESATRSRLTHTAMLQTGFSLTDRVSVDMFVPWIRQEREIRFLGSISDFTSTSGIGDIVLLGKYSLLKENKKGTLGIAFGVKLPTGVSTKVNNNNLQLNADLQPGSGAFDEVLILDYQKQLKKRPSTTFFARGVATRKGKNNNYLGNNQYQFGFEWQTFLGFSDRILIRKKIIDPSLAFRFRSASADQFNGENLTGTGGRWLFLNPSISYWKGQNMSFTVSGDIPLVSYVVDTQVTPTYRINIGMFYKLSLKKKEHILQNFSL